MTDQKELASRLEAVLEKFRAARRADQITKADIVVIEDALSALAQPAQPAGGG